MTMAKRETTLSARVAEEIRAMMGRRRVTGATIARELGVSQAWVSNRLSGQQAIDLNELERIADVLQVTPFDLLPRVVTTQDSPLRFATRPGAYPNGRTAPGGPRRPVRLSAPLAA